MRSRSKPVLGIQYTQTKAPTMHTPARYMLDISLSTVLLNPSDNNGVCLLTDSILDPSFKVIIIYQLPCVTHGPIPSPSH